MTKILGYENREIASLYLLSTTMVVIVADVIYKDVCFFTSGVFAGIGAGFTESSKNPDGLLFICKKIVAGHGVNSNKFLGKIRRIAGKLLDSPAYFL